VAVTCRVPGVAVDDSVLEHVAVAPVPANMHIAVGVKNAFPVGVTGVPAMDESVTVMVHEVVCPTSIVDGVQLTLIVVARLLTATVAGATVLLLPAWRVSPGE
jgi:hypothetical protein